MRQSEVALEPNAPARVALNGACAGLVFVELIVTLLMWAPIPAGWMWIGAQVYTATGSLFADGVVVMTGFLATITAAMAALNRLDRAWVSLRRRAGHQQRDGMLTRVVVFSATLGLIGFYVWYYLLSDAFVLPFMPMQ
jgi:hypothetical protein